MPYQKSGQKKKDVMSLRWQKILEYYFNCISIENAGEITLYSSGKNKEFIQIPDKKAKEWIKKKKKKLEIKINESEIESFIRGPRWSRKSLSFFYGFPSYIKHVSSSKKGWSGSIIQPILVFDIDVARTEKGYSFSLINENPRINSAFLSKKSLSTSVEERKHISELVLRSWKENRDRRENMISVLKGIEKIISQETIFSKKILNGEISTLEKVKEGGIHPVATIFKRQSSPYTFGLEKEISALRKNSNPNNVWSIILERNGEELAKKKESNSLLEITALNKEQRNAVESAFSNTLTVVTGPPGTGKSQIVLNVVANALLNNETVIFGSKNHKAVDVVIERLMHLQSEPVILKYGKKEKEAYFAEKLLSAIQRAAGDNLEKINYSIKKNKKKIEKTRISKDQAKETLMRI